MFQQSTPCWLPIAAATWLNGGTPAQSSTEEMADHCPSFKGLRAEFSVRRVWLQTLAKHGTSLSRCTRFLRVHSTLEFLRHALQDTHSENRPLLDQVWWSRPVHPYYLRPESPYRRQQTNAWSLQKERKRAAFIGRSQCRATRIRIRTLEPWSWAITRKTPTSELRLTKRHHFTMTAEHTMFTLRKQRFVPD